jgi:HD-like signal output (HDOD) protein
MLRYLELGRDNWGFSIEVALFCHTVLLVSPRRVLEEIYFCGVLWCVLM